MTSSIAIVGMACRYPDANTVNQLFENSIAQRRSFRKIPEIRLGSAYFNQSDKAKDQAYTHQAAVIKNFDFNRKWFRISQMSYEVTDLTHWLALTVAKEAIEDIQFRKNVSHPKQEATSVIVGNTLTGEFSRANVMRLRWPYVRKVVAEQLLSENSALKDCELNRLLRELEARYKQPFPTPNEDFLAGGLANTIAGRICNHFDFKGGGYIIDGACSSSLLAVTNACSALALKNADIVLAGGVDLSIDPFEMVGFSRSAALAKNQMLVYDENSEGFWPGEGCGFVALMRYEDAVEQCEHIHAVIRGWGISSDGRGGLTRPSPEGQMLALQRCYNLAGYGIESVGYFEGHGTGTKIGDAVELEALITARSKNKKLINPAVISSIKANIGHTKAAAGLAGLLRATKCLSEKVLPPTTGCEQPHSLFKNNPNNLAPSKELRLWKSEQVNRRAGVSAMGFGGINTHITLEETPTRQQRRSVSVLQDEGFKYLKAFQDAELFLFKAIRIEDLAWTIDHVANFAEACSQAELTDLAAELADRATDGALSHWKAAIVARNPTELKYKLKLLKEALEHSNGTDFYKEITEGVFLAAGSKNGKIGLVFPGQGAPIRQQGGIQARRFDEVKHIYQRASLETFNNRENTDFAQPAIVTASLSGLEILKKIGIYGDLAIGHSLGELTALHWAGYFDATTLLTIAKLRGQVIANETNTAGAMVAIKADYEQSLREISEEKNLFIANINSPQQTVVSGPRREVTKLLTKLQQKGILARILPVKQAFHSPSMASVSNVFLNMLENMDFYPGKRQIISTVTNNFLSPNIDIATHLSTQLVSPVYFLTAINSATEKVDLFLEVGPGNIMTNLIRSFCKTPAMSIDVGGKSLVPFLHGIAAAYTLGCTPQIIKLFNDRFTRKFDWGWTPKFIPNPCEVIPSKIELEIPSEAELEIEQKLTENKLTEIKSHDNVREQLCQVIANHIGLPIWTLEDNSRMLSELHLNSITVGEIITRTSKSIGIAPPMDLTEYADASISEIAIALEQLKEAETNNETAQTIEIPGLESWVRYFQITHQSSSRIKVNNNFIQGEWEGFGIITESEKAILQELNSNPYGDGIIIWLSDNPKIDELDELLQAAQKCIERSKKSTSSLSFVIVQYGWGYGGFARSFFVENKNINTLVINFASKKNNNSIKWIVQEIDESKSGFNEVFIDATGERKEARLKLVKPALSTTGSLIDENDLILVTGGGKGISAECAYQLARQTGCALLILGRSNPQENAELANNLQRLRNAEIRVSYQLANITDINDCKIAITRGIAELGASITGIIHGAGLNNPCLIANLSISRMKETIAPKVDGLKNLLTTIEPKNLKIIATFSSIIARTGLQGEGDYALANEWLSYETEKLQLRYPHCRCLAIEWSVWSGTGMGQRLGRLDILLKQGIQAISIDDGVNEFLKLINTPNLPASLIVSGRFGKTPTLVGNEPPKKLFRFIDSILVYYPDTELIAECHLSSKSDFYLKDHVINGEQLLPAVISLEAMAEAAFVLMHEHKWTSPIFENILFHKAIVIPDDRDTKEITLRIIALANTIDSISLAIRCSTTDFQVNHVEAHCTLGNKIDLKRENSHIKDLPKDIIKPFNTEKELYKNILFQNGRFKRVKGYQLIEARQCMAQLSSSNVNHSNVNQWFSQELPQQLLLGDPGVRDAAIHAIQACIPHKIVIPTAVEKIEFSKLDTFETYRTFAKEIADRGDKLIYDLIILEQNGQQIEYWKGITLQIIGEQPNLHLNSPPLMASFLERRVTESITQAELKVSITPTTNQEKIRTATIDLNHRPDGKPNSSNSHFQSAAYSKDWKLKVNSKIPIGCDLQYILDKQVNDWESMIGKEGIKLAKVISEIIQEKLDISATRVWTAREAMKKAGFPASAPLIVEPNASSEWIVLRSGNSQIFSSLIDSQIIKIAICIAFRLIDL